MHFNITGIFTLCLIIFCFQALADSLENLPPEWQHQLKTVLQVDISPLKADEQKAIIESRSNIEALLLSKQPGPDALASEYGRLGNLYLIHQLYTSADACYENAMQLAPDYFPWAYYSAYLAQQNGNMQTALTRYKKALKLDPEYLPASYRLARVYLDLNRLDEAETLFNSLLEEPAYKAAAYNGLGQILVTRQDHINAAEHFRQALTLEPGATRLHYPLALSLRATGQNEEAKQHLKLYGKKELVIHDRLVDSLQALRNPASRHFVTAMTAVLRKEYAKAVADFESGLKYEPENAAARTSYARVLYLNGDREKARTQLERIIAQYPDKTLALFLLALLDDESNNKEQAAKSYKRVIQLNAKHIGANFFLGNYFLHNKEYSKAIRHYDVVLQNEEKNTPAQIFKLVAMMGNGASDKELLTVVEKITVTATDIPPIKRIQILLLALSSDAEVRDSEQAQKLAEQMYKSSRYPVNLELLALSTASTGDLSMAANQMRKALTEEKQHKNSRSLTRMSNNLLLLEKGALPELDWHEETSHMLPPPTNALATFRNYPDANPI